MMHGVGCHCDQCYATMMEVFKRDEARNTIVPVTGKPFGSSDYPPIKEPTLKSSVFGETDLGKVNGKLHGFLNK